MPTQALVSDHIVYETFISSGAPPVINFGTMMAMLDEASIPVDRRVLTVSSTSYKEDLPLDSVARAYAGAFFSQDLKADELLIGRRLEADTAPYFVWGPANEADYLVYKAIADAEFAVQDSGANVADAIGIDFSATTNLAQCYALIETTLQALVAPAVVGLDSATVTVDSSGRVSINMPVAVAGATSPTITVVPVTAGAGTDISTLMDATNGISVVGYDEETILESYAAIKSVDDGFYNVESIRATDADNLLLAPEIETEIRQLTAVTKTVACENPESTTDIAAVLQSTGMSRTLLIYDPLMDTQFACAVDGRVLPEEEGSADWAFSQLTGVEGSRLDTGVREALKAKNCNYFESVKGYRTYLYPGLNSTKIDKRVILGIDWFDNTNQIETFGIRMSQKFMGFDNETLTKIQEILERNSGIAISRKIFTDSASRPFTITLPDEDDFTDTERETREMIITDAYKGWATASVLDMYVRGSVTV